MKKILTIIILSFTFLFVLAGCNFGSSNKNDNTYFKGEYKKVDHIRIYSSQGSSSDLMSSEEIYYHETLREYIVDSITVTKSVYARTIINVYYNSTIKTVKIETITVYAEKGPDSAQGEGTIKETDRETEEKYIELISNNYIEIIYSKEANK